MGTALFDYDALDEAVDLQRRSYRLLRWLSDAIPREAHHRQAWRSAEGSFVDCVGYAVLRLDWATWGTPAPTPPP